VISVKGLRYHAYWNRFPPPGSKRVETGIRLLADSPNAGLRAGIGVSDPGQTLNGGASGGPTLVLLEVLPSEAMVTKRSVSLDDEVASAVEDAAKQDGISFSAWLSTAAEKQLQVRQGLRGVAAWEGETGSLSAEELAAGEALLARLRSGVSSVTSRVRRR
jgi:hypothetical protein